MDLKHDSHSVSTEEESKINKRNKTMTSKGLFYTLDIKSHAIKKLCKKLMKIENSIDTLLKSETIDYEDVRKAYFEWLTVCEYILEDRRNYSSLVHKHDVPEEYVDFLTNLDCDIECFKDFQHYISSWLQEKEPERRQKAHTEDSASRMSKGDQRSNSSSHRSNVSSARLKEEQRRAELQIKAAALDRKYELELEKARLKLEEDKFDLKTEMEISDARWKVLDEYEGQSSIHSSRLRRQSLDIKSTDQQNQFRYTYDARYPELSQRGDTDNGTFEMTSTAERRQSPKRITARQGIPDQSHTGGTSDNVISTVIKQMRKPATDLMVFSGDPLQYRKFMRQFKTRILSNTDDYDEILNYLEQFTSGEVRNIVSSYGYLDAQHGYPAAMRELEERYGNEEVIVNAFISKALNWPYIKAENPRSLDEFAIFLSECANAVKGDILDNTENIQRLIVKLPYHYQDKCRSQIQSIREAGRQVKFLDLVNFVRKESWKANDPMFGKEALQGKAQASISKGYPRSSSNSYPRTKLTLATDVSSSLRTSSAPPRPRKTSSAPPPAPPQLTSSALPPPRKTTSAPPPRQTSSLPPPNSTPPPPTPQEPYRRCRYCGSGEHRVSECEQFTTIPYDEMVTFIKENGLCFRCFKRGHMSKECRSQIVCTKCNGRHNVFLHLDGANVQQQDTHRVQASSCLSSDMGVGEDTEAVCTMVIIPVKVRRKEGLQAIDTYAFLDPGSSASFCTESLLNRLGASGKQMKIDIDSMGAPRTINTKAVTGMQIGNMNMENFVNLPKMFSVDKLPVDKTHIPSCDDVRKWTHLNDIKIPKIDADIGIMIGNNVPDAYSPLEIRTGPEHAPHATRTRLGWALWNVSRAATETQEMKNIRLTLNRTDIAIKECENCKELDRMVRDSFKIDFPERIIDDKNQHSQEDKVFLKKVEESIRMCDGHYEIALPFRDKNVQFPYNFSLAFKNLMRLRRQMERDNNFRLEYTSFMNKMLEKNFAERIPDHEPEPKGGLVWYIPHHGVFHPKKKKLRVVFNCAATFNGTSLNQELLSGPDLTNNLVAVLLRFRKERIAVKGDIGSMFYQVHVTKDQWNYQRYLWWPDGDYTRDPVKYRMKVHMFGSTSSPSCANAALLQTAMENQKNFEPKTAEIIRNNFYVDDCLFSEKNVSDAVRSVQQVTSMCQLGGFKLTKWVSNSLDVLNSIPEEDRDDNVKTLNLDPLESGQVERALGVVWNIHMDTFGFKIHAADVTCTRRHVLSIVSSIFDPLGFISPFVLKAKILLQDMCREGLEWDEEVTGSKLSEWQDWVEDLPLLQEVSIPRCYKPSHFETGTSTQLHLFSDASDEGYGLTDYLRFIDLTGNISCSLVMAKARVTPTKKVTIPRLELTAACIAVKLARFLQRELQTKLDSTHYWTDSMSVIRYINNKTTRFKTFVANRITIIQDGSDATQWRYVQSAHNPADAASRGLRMENFLKLDHWFHGPSFLRRPDDEWPKAIETGERDIQDDPELKQKELKVVATTVTDENVDIMDRIMNYSSSWMKLKRIVGWFLLYMTNLRKNVKEGTPSKTEKASVKLTVEIIKKAETAILRFVQRRYLKDTILALKNQSQEYKLDKSVRKLDPFITDGLIRVGGRLSQASIPYEAKHQVLLPKNCHVSRLIVQDSHESVGHMGKAAMMSHLRQTYWIPGVGNLIKSITSNCVPCKKYTAKQMEQKMADLPIDRVTPDEPPFSRVGVDFFGPFMVKRGRANVKRYGVVFTCLSMRAIHLEVAASMDTSSCINAFRRFFARRGHPKKVWTDNGTNLVGCERELREEIERWNHHQINESLLQRNISWQFNPPSASHHGGVWERMIRTIRKILYSLMQGQVIHLDDDGLQTLFCEVEVIINSRPITTVTNDIHDLMPLTPNDLLMIRSPETLPPGVFNSDDCFLKRRWRQIQYLSDAFWKRWSKEYLTSLQERAKWTKVQENIAVNDIVLIMDNQPRNAWSLGRVIEVFPDRKGLTRIAKVRTATSKVMRPIAKLCRLVEQ